MRYWCKKGSGPVVVTSFALRQWHIDPVIPSMHTNARGNLLGMQRDDVDADVAWSDYQMVPFQHSSHETRVTSAVEGLGWQRRKAVSSNHALLLLCFPFPSFSLVESCDVLFFASRKPKSQVRVKRPLSPFSGVNHYGVHQVEGCISYSRHGTVEVAITTVHTFDSEGRYKTHISFLTRT